MLLLFVVSLDRRLASEKKCLCSASGKTHLEEPTISIIAFPECALVGMAVLFMLEEPCWFMDFCLRLTGCHTYVDCMGAMGHDLGHAKRQSLLLDLRKPWDFLYG